MINPVELWDSLDSATQRTLGALAIANELSLQISLGFDLEEPTLSLSECKAAEKTNQACETALTFIVDTRLPQAFDADGNALRPDLNTLGIRQCTTCGCTDQFGCEDGCTWIGLTLCDACVDMTGKEQPRDPGQP